MSDLRATAASRVGEHMASWLETQIPGATNMEIRDIVEPKQGFSSETVLFKAMWKEEGVQRERDLVARIQRQTICPMLADVFFQYDVMKAIGENSDTAIPNIAFVERTGAVLDEPFFLMDRAEGRVPTDFPGFHGEGWVFDLPEEDRTRLWWNGIKEMEKLHRIGWEKFPFLAKGTKERPGSRFYMQDFMQTWLDWAAQGQSFPAIEEAIDYLNTHAPKNEHSGLVWNDSRMGNTMFADDLSVAAFFDFEVSSLGPAEIDLAWWLYCEDLFSIQFGIKRLAGIPQGEEAIRGFERIYGRPMPEFDYYMAISALKHAMLAIRDYSNGKTLGAPEALPNFAMEHLALYIDRHKSRVPA